MPIPLANQMDDFVSQESTGDFAELNSSFLAGESTGLLWDGGSPQTFKKGRHIFAGSEHPLGGGELAWKLVLQYFARSDSFLWDDGWFSNLIDHHSRGRRHSTWRNESDAPYYWICTTGDLLWALWEMARRFVLFGTRVVYLSIIRVDHGPLGDNPRQISVDLYQELRLHRMTEIDEKWRFACNVAKNSKERSFLGRIPSEDVLRTYTFTPEVSCLVHRNAASSSLTCEQSVGFKLPAQYFPHPQDLATKSWLECLPWDPKEELSYRDATKCMPSAEQFEDMARKAKNVERKAQDNAAAEVATVEAQVAKLEAIDIAAAEEELVKELASEAQVDRWDAMQRAAAEEEEELVEYFAFETQVDKWEAMQREAAEAEELVEYFAFETQVDKWEALQREAAEEEELVEYFVHEAQVDKWEAIERAATEEAELFGYLAFETDSDDWDVIDRAWAREKRRKAARTVAAIPDDDVSSAVTTPI